MRYHYYLIGALGQLERGCSEVSIAQLLVGLLDTGAIGIVDGKVHSGADIADRSTGEGCKWGMLNLVDAHRQVAFLLSALCFTLSTFNDRLLAAHHGHYHHESQCHLHQNSLCFIHSYILFNDFLSLRQIDTLGGASHLTSLHVIDSQGARLLR